MNGNRRLDLAKLLITCFNTIYTLILHRPIHWVGITGIYNQCLNSCLLLHAAVHNHLTQSGIATLLKNKKGWHIRLSCQWNDVVSWMKQHGPSLDHDLSNFPSHAFSRSSLSTVTNCITPAHKHMRIVTQWHLQMVHGKTSTQEFSEIFIVRYII